MSNFLKRTFTASLFVIVLIGCTLAGKYSLSALFFFVTVIGLWEFYSLAEKNTDNHPQKIMGILLGAFIYILIAAYSFNIIPLKLFVAIVPLIFFVFISELFFKKTFPFRNIAYTLLGPIYVAVPFSLINYIGINSGTKEYHPEYILGIYFILWANDTGAFLVGSKIGKTKLLERVSPGKTWEGSAGGALLGFIVTYIISIYFSDNSLKVLEWFVIGFILIVIGTMGDLVESMLKRSKNVKDSGTLLPGHGGILDRFDSLILSLPFIYFYLVLKG